MPKNEFKRTLPCKLTAEERDEIGGQLASREIERERVENEKRLVNSDYRTKLNGLDEEIMAMAKQRDTGVMEREVTCDRRRNDRLGQWETWRLDTDELVESTPYTFEDRQGTLPDATNATDSESEHEAAAEKPKKRGRAKAKRNHAQAEVAE